MITIQDMFRYGVDRIIPDLLVPPSDGVQINLGPGDKKIIGYMLDSGPDVGRTIGVGPSHDRLCDVEWAAHDPLPFPDDSVSAVHAYQFLEHLTGRVAIKVLDEVERVLAPGGVMFAATPYPGHGAFLQDLDHKSAWTEDTWAHIFDNPYYRSVQKEWRLKVHACFIMGIVERNLNLFTQLAKV